MFKDILMEIKLAALQILVPVAQVACPFPS